ncbi:hypothetical protein Hanom_Chr05g00409341 [Helianthus anomalus]
MTDATKPEQRVSLLILGTLNDWVVMVVLNDWVVMVVLMCRGFFIYTLLFSEIVS